MSDRERKCRFERASVVCVNGQRVECNHSARRVYVERLCMQREEMAEQREAQIEATSRFSLKQYCNVWQSALPSRNDSFRD